MAEFTDPGTTFRVVRVEKLQLSRGPLNVRVELVGEGGELDGVHLFANHMDGRPLVTDQGTRAQVWIDLCTCPE